MSRSTWACELKFGSSWCFVGRRRHAPRERVSWNINVVICQREITSHAPRERVSWNVEERSRINLAGVTLHVSVWVEICLSEVRITLSLSRSTWACELKFLSTFTQTFLHYVTLHVSVWVEMLTRPLKSFYFVVTLHVSVWVEIPKRYYKAWSQWVTLHVSVWVEITPALMILWIKSSHAPRERVSWNHWNW